MVNKLMIRYAVECLDFLKDRSPAKQYKNENSEDEGYLLNGKIEQ